MRGKIVKELNGTFAMTMNSLIIEVRAVREAMADIIEHSCMHTE